MMGNGVTVADGIVAQNASDIASVICNQLLTSNIVPSNISVGASPFTYQNVLTRPVSVMVSGGTVTTISFSRDGSNFFVAGLLGGMYHLSAGDFLRVAYAVAPTMTLIPF